MQKRLFKLLFRVCPPDSGTAGPSEGLEDREMILDPPSAEDSIFSSTDNIAVEEAADSVCTEGLVVEVENDDGSDAEEGRVVRFLQKGLSLQAECWQPLRLSLHCS